MEDDEKAMTQEEVMSNFVTFAAEGDLHAQKANYSEAIEAYTRALNLRANDKNVLVSRSRCLLLVGDSQASLQDAQQAMDLDKNFFKALFQKAEALYSMGDFEAALMFYHRGNRLRPELKEFHIGIQKSREAIENSIGDPAVKISIDPAMKKTVLQIFANQPQQFTGSVPTQTTTQRLAPPARATGGRDNAPQTPNVHNTVNASNPASVNAYLSHRGISPPPSSSLTPAMEAKLLGDLYEDKAYLSSLLSDRDLLEHPNDKVLSLVADGLRYFDTRIDFWRQQNPLYARSAHCKQAAKDSVKQKERVRQKIEAGRGGKSRKASFLPPINEAGNRSNVRTPKSQAV